MWPTSLCKIFTFQTSERILEIDEGSEEQATFCGRPSCLSERAQFALFGLLQILISTGYFCSYAYTEKGKGFNIKAVTQMSDELTLWTNALLFVNGLSNLFSDSLVQRLNVLSHQMQASLLPATLSLGVVMKIGIQYLGMRIVDKVYGLGVVVVQHVPSVGVAYAASRMHGMKTSEVF